MLDRLLAAAGGVYRGGRARLNSVAKAIGSLSRGIFSRVAIGPPEVRWVDGVADVAARCPPGLRQIFSPRRVSGQRVFVFAGGFAVAGAPAVNFGWGFCRARCPRR